MKLSDIATKMLWVICVLLLLLVAGSIAYYRSLLFLPFAYGALLGAAVNMVKVVMLDRTVKKAVGMESNDAGNYVRLQYFLRFVLTGAVLVLAAKVPFISIWGAAAGILTMQFAAFCAKRFV